MDLPGYEIVEMLGAGGFGTVYRARQLAVRREVALKIDSRVLATERDRRRFLREVTAAGRLSGHPHVVAVYDAGVLPDGRPYMVLELCPHGSLADRLADHGPFPAEEVRDIGVRIAGALAAAHATGVLHRDVKPGNILIDGYGNVALADFGLAAMPAPGLESSATREALTPAFAPPEAFRLTEPAPAGDVYSLAASLYALLSGRPPHVPPDGRIGIAELMAAQTRPVPDPPGAPPALVAVLRQAMAYEVSVRTPSASAFQNALAALDLRDHDPYAVGTAAGAVALAGGGGRGGGGRGPAGHEQPTAGGERGHATTRPRGPVSGPADPAGAATRRVLLGAAALVTAGIIGAGALVASAQGRDGDGDTADSGQGTLGGTAATVTAGAGATRTAAPGGTAGDGPGGPAVPTSTEYCPAARVPGAQAACPRTAECWGGMVSHAGDTSATRRDCRTTHTWETFAIAAMPRDGETWNDAELREHPTVKRLCSINVLLASRSGTGRKPPAARWEASVLPPSKAAYERGDRSYRCVGTQGLDTLRGAVFRPLTG